MKHAVTGGFGYSGSYIVKRLLEAGEEVVTLTNTRRSAGSPDIVTYPLKFDDTLVKALTGVDVLYNTYWVRFNYGDFTHREAVENSQTLFHAAKRAGVRRIVHISITNPSELSPLDYFSGKAKVERVLKEARISYAVLRPAVLFGGNDILINNIAWLLRMLPVFGVFGDGSYRLQPIYVDDLAALAVDQGRGSENTVINAIGPETFTYRELVTTLGRIIGVSRPIVNVPPFLGLAAGRVIGYLMRDVTITSDEIKGLMDNLLFVDTPPTGTNRLSDWAIEHADSLGIRYASELARR